MSILGIRHSAGIASIPCGDKFVRRTQRHTTSEASILKSQPNPQPAVRIREHLRRPPPALPMCIHSCWKLETPLRAQALAESPHPTETPHPLDCKAAEPGELEAQSGAMRIHASACFFIGHLHPNSRCTLFAHPFYMGPRTQCPQSTPQADC